MAPIEPYAPCPCGSGEKYKWCCQKVEPVLQKTVRLVQSGQYDAAVESLDEGLKKHPGNALLLSNKAAVLIEREDLPGARTVLIDTLRVHPEHFSSHLYLVSLDAQLDGAAAGAARLQQALTAVAPGRRAAFARAAEGIGRLFLDAGKAAAAAHLRLASRLDPEDKEVRGPLRALMGSPNVPVIMKQDYPFKDAPERLDAARRARFDAALGWAREGLWNAASAAFDLLSADATHEADLAVACGVNAGLCRMYVGDDAGATACLRQAIARMGVTNEAVELEALCQTIDPGRRDDRVERIQWIWPLRAREKLLAALRADKSIVEYDPRPIDESDDHSPEVLEFCVLDRAALPADAFLSRLDLNAADIPLVQGRFLVGLEIAVVEAFDDGRLDALGERFRTVAGDAIPPAHPKMKVVGRVNREQLALAWEWQSTAMIDLALDERLARDQRRRIDAEVWPNTPFRALKNRTPKKAALDGDAEVPLRAALLLRRDDCLTAEQFEKVEALRGKLNIPGEPALDPSTIDLAAVHLSRLIDIDTARLDDARLSLYEARARANVVRPALERALRALIERMPRDEPATLESRTRITLLINLLASRGDFDEAAEWLARGRAAETDTTRRFAAPHWEMTEIRLRTQTVEPEVWVPELALVLDRYRGDENAGAIILRHLVELGFVQPTANPENPSEVMLDTRILRMLLAEHGPRVTTAAGELGIAATRGGIWTPGSDTGGGGGAKGGIWTPGGSAASESPERSKLIIPGR